MSKLSSRECTIICILARFSTRGRRALSSRGRALQPKPSSSEKKEKLYRAQKQIAKTEQNIAHSSAPDSGQPNTCPIDLNPLISNPNLSTLNPNLYTPNPNLLTRISKPLIPLPSSRPGRCFRVSRLCPGRRRVATMRGNMGYSLNSLTLGGIYIYIYIYI